MLTIHRKRATRVKDAQVAIVASTYNAKYVDGMLKAAKASLVRAGVQLEVVRVPGSFEIPVAARWLLSERPEIEAIICLGLIWQGETTHADHIGSSVTQSLMTLAVESGVPMVHEVLHVKTSEQASARCLDPKTNRGAEAATTAIEMIRLRRSIRKTSTR